MWRLSYNKLLDAFVKYERETEHQGSGYADKSDHNHFCLPFAAVFQPYRVMPTWFLLKNPPVENTRRQQRIHQAAEENC
jgi:hypothetical protein